MQSKVLTPITQALEDGKLSRRELKILMARSNSPAIWRLLIWIAVLTGTGMLINKTIDTHWVWVAMFIHGVVIVHHFSLQHECVHFTAFKHRWLSNVVGNICGFIIILPHQHFRYEHCDHHTYTQLHGKDPELILFPTSIWKYLWYISSFPYWRNKFVEISMHFVGQLRDAEKVFIPKDAKKIVFWEARLMVIGYVSILVFCIKNEWWTPLWYWWLPLFIGEPVMRAIRLTEHVGRPNSSNMKENTRSNLISLPLRFLCWNMNYHAEHHYASSIPFHALPKLHARLKEYIFVEPNGYLGAHIEILRQLKVLKYKNNEPDRGTQ